MSNSTDSARAAGLGFLVITGAKLWFMVGGALIGLGLPYLVGAAGYGKYTDINNSLGLFSMVMVTGMTQAVAHAVSAHPEQAGGTVRRALWGIGLLGGLIGLAGALLAPLIAEARGDALMTSAYRGAAVVVFAYGLYATLIGYLNGRQLFLRQALFDIAYTTLKASLVLGGAYFALRSAGPEAFCLPPACAEGGAPEPTALGGAMTAVFGGFALASVLILLAAGARIGRELDPGAPAPGLWKFAAQVMASQLVFQLVFRQDVLLIPFIAQGGLGEVVAPLTQVETDRVLGHYGLAASLARLPWQATLAITFVIFPMVSAATFTDDPQRARDYVRQTLRYSLLLIATAAVAFTAVPTLIVDGAWNADFEPAAIALTVLAPAYVCFALFNIANTVLTASGRAATVLGISIATALAAFASYALILPGAADPDALLQRAAVATLVPFALGLALSGGALYRLYGPPIAAATVARVVGLGLLVCALGRLAPAVADITARFAPQGGKLARLVGLGYGGGMALLVVLAFLALLFVTREFGPEDRARFARVLSRKRPQ